MKNICFVTNTNLYEDNHMRVLSDSFQMNYIRIRILILLFPFLFFCEFAFSQNEGMGTTSHEVKEIKNILSNSKSTMETYSIYNAWWEDMQDFDEDGYTRYRKLYFDVDVSSGSYQVYAKIYKIPSIGLWRLYYTTSNFTITGNLSSDKYWVAIGSPNNELSHSIYDFRIRIYKAGTSTEVVEYDNDNDSDLNDEKFETASQDPKPNLTLQSPGFIMNNGGNITMDVTVENSGNGSSSPCYLGYYASTNKTITTSDYLLGTDYVSGLPPSGRSYETITFNWCSQSLPANNYYHGFIVDYEGIIDETSESDNVYFVDLDSSPTPPTVSASTTSHTTCGQCNGIVTAQGNWGFSPLTYSWSGGLGNGQNHSGVCSGTYTVTVTDGIGCTGTDQITVNSSPSCTSPTANVPNNSGTCSVIMNCNASGGSCDNIAYKWYSGTSCSGTVIGTNSSLNVTESGNYSCKAYITGYEATCYDCAYGYATVASKPGKAIVSGNSPVCSGSTETYTASSTGATSFTWTVPSDWTITSGQGTSSIKVTVVSNSGNVCATPSNMICGNGLQGCKSVTVTALPTATISYVGSPFCKSLGAGQPVTLAGTPGGTYTAAPAGLTLDGVTGAINPVTSTAGAYTVTYTIAAAGGCGVITASTPVTITALPTASISYTGSPWCSTAGVQNVTLVGTSGGTYSAAPAGLSINPVTGAITPGTSSAETYTVTYTITAAGGCGVVTATTPVTITALPIATFSYAGTPYCSNATDPSPTYSGGGVAGVFSSTAGLVFLSTATGQVDLSASTAGTYTVNNTIAAAGGCGIVTATGNITITTLPTAAISYAGSPWCSTAGVQNVTLIGTSGGTYSAAPAGLSINPVTGTITPGTSTGGTYTVSYMIAAAGGCGDVTATTSVAVISKPDQATVSGNSPVCSGNTGTFTASSTGAISYNWTVPSDWTITSGQGTSSITVTAGSNSGNVCATPSNCSGNGLQDCIAVSTGVKSKITDKWGDVLICYNLGDSIISYQWYKGVNPISNAASQFYQTKKQSGIYKVEIIDKDGCKNVSNEISISGTKSLSVYPNPASVSFALKLNDESEGRAVISIFNSIGIKVMEFQAENINDELLKEIPVNNLDEGIYVIQVLLNNKDLYYEKIVIAK